MPAYLIDWQLWKNLLPVPLMATIVAALAAFPKSSATLDFCRRWTVLLSFALLGFVVGELTGQSREAAVAATIGAVLTLLGGAMVYLLDERQERQLLASLAVSVLCACLMLGANWGAAIREEAIASRSSASYRIHQEIEEQLLRDLRQELGLPVPSNPAAQPTDGK